MTSFDEPGAEYSPNPRLFNAFWKKMNELTVSRPTTKAEKDRDDASKRAAAFHKVSENLSAIKEFLDDIISVAEKIKEASGKTHNLDVLISKLKRHTSVVALATNMANVTDDAVQAAVETQSELSAWYRDAYSKCKSEGDPYSDQEFICLAAIDRLYQGRNVKSVLGNQDGSFVRRVFDKWRDRLKDLVLPI